MVHVQDAACIDHPIPAAILIHARDEARRITMITGRCECAKVQYEVAGDISDYCHCHCSICRRLHGAAFVSWGGVSRDAFRYTSGEDCLRTYSFSEKADSIFCNKCGSRILVDYKPEADMLYLAMGMIDGDVSLPPGYHQFTGSKARWFEISDDLPQHDGWPPDE